MVAVPSAGLRSRSGWVAVWVSNGACRGLFGAGRCWCGLVFCLVSVPGQGLLGCGVIHGKEKVYGSIP